MPTPDFATTFGSFDLRINGHVFHLRTSLRAAYALEQKYDGFEKLFVDLMMDKFSAHFDVLDATIRDDDREKLAELRALPLRQWQSANLGWIALGAAIALAGIDTDHTDAPAAVPGAKISYKAYFEDLFRKATGWLGWSADHAWNATPFEIIAALEGRAEFIRATSRATDNPDTASSYDPSDLTFDEAGMAELAAMARH